MRQILQNLRNGETTLTEAPCPAVRSGHVLIRTRASVISPGTERMLLDFGKAGFIDKARKQPDKVRQVFDKARTDGLMPTVEAVRAKLEQPIPLGYANAGVVLEVGAGVTGFAPGDRVVSNGPHAEIVSVPQNLCAPIPDDVDDESAAFTVIAAIALQSVRLAQPTLGETFVVAGLGLIGQLAVQILRAHGCRVLGTDFDPERCSMAEAFGAKAVDLSTGADKAVGAAHRFSRGRGVDGVIIAAATDSDEPMHQAAAMCRKKGRIVLVGVVGLKLSRDDFYKKELSFQVSCSYGPGRYDPAYEDRGQDYPLPFVRWTAQRNFEAVLDLMAQKAIDTAPLVSAKHPIERATDAYAALGGGGGGLGIVLSYPDAVDEATLRTRTIRLVAALGQVSPGGPNIGIIGAGNYASRVLMPAFEKAGAHLEVVATRGGTSGVLAGRKHGFRRATTDVDEVFGGDRVDTVVIATRHDTHAGYAVRALKAGRHVFCEKPLCLTRDELTDIERAHADARKLLMVGFNRRFAPHVVAMRELLAGTGGPKCMTMIVNAGAIPGDHWTQGGEGGGRIIGEACHFVDLLRFLVDASIERVAAVSVGAGAGAGDDKATITLGFADGSIGTVHYFANGHRAVSKERLEVFCDGRVLALDNFRALETHGFAMRRRLPLLKRQDKGQAACAAAFVEAVRRGGPSPIAFEEIVEVSKAMFDVVDQLRARA